MNAVIGAYLNELGLSTNAIFGMTRKGAMEMEWLNDELVKGWGLKVEALQPSRSIPIPAQPAVEASPRMPLAPASPQPGRPAIRAVVRTIFGTGLPLNQGLLFSPTILVIPENAVVIIEDTCSHRVSWARWCLVSYRGKLGYVNGIYLRILTDRSHPVRHRSGR